MKPFREVEPQMRKAHCVPPTTDELRQAWNRPGMTPLRFLGWTFEHAMTVPTVRWSLEKSAIAARKEHHTPAQPRLI